MHYVFRYDGDYRKRQSNNQQKQQEDNKNETMINSKDCNSTSGHKTMKDNKTNNIITSITKPVPVTSVQLDDNTKHR